MDATALESEARTAIAAAADPDALEELRVRYLGRKSPLKLALREVRDRETGMALNAARAAIEEALEQRERELTSDVVEDVDFDVTLPGEAPPLGQLHLITQVRRTVEDAFLGLGYEVRDDREVETVEFNFDKLAFPEWHPARSPRDTFFFDGTRLLRTETSPSQIHIMEEREPPIYMVSLGRVYRRDTIDATHFTIFHQFEGLAVDRGLTLADLRGTLLHVMRALYGAERRVRFRTHYFPFTEPSMEPDVSCPICGGEGCRVCKHSGWIEMGGSGMVDPAVFENVGYDPEEWTGFAFGMGLERTRPASPRGPRPAPVLGERPPRPEAVLMRVPLSLAARLRPAADARRRAGRPAEHQRGRGEHDRAARAGRRGRQPRSLPRRQGPRGGQAPERRPAPALPGRRGRGSAAPDRLRRVELRRRRHGRGRAAGREAPGRRCAARGGEAARRGLARE